MHEWQVAVHVIRCQAARQVTKQQVWELGKTLLLLLLLLVGAAVLDQLLQGEGAGGSLQEPDATAACGAGWHSDQLPILHAANGRASTAGMSHLGACAYKHELVCADSHPNRTAAHLAAAQPVPKRWVKSQHSCHSSFQGLSVKGGVGKHQGLLQENCGCGKAVQEGRLLLLECSTIRSNDCLLPLDWFRQFRGSLCVLEQGKHCGNRSVLLLLRLVQVC